MKEEDIPKIVELSRQFHQESPYRMLPFDPELAEDNLLSALGKDHNLLLVMLKDGVIVGVLGGQLRSPPFFSGTLAVEVFFYIVPSLRRSKKTLILLDAFIEWAQSQGVDGIVCGSFPDSPIWKYYEKKGFNQTESLYVKWLQ